MATLPSKVYDFTSLFLSLCIFKRLKWIVEFQRAVNKTPRMLEALQDILFSGCRLDAEFQAAEWKAYDTFVMLNSIMRAMIGTVDTAKRR